MNASHSAMDALDTMYVTVAVNIMKAFYALHAMDFLEAMNAMDVCNV